MRTVTLASLAVVMASVSACQLATESVDTRDIVIAADLELSGATASVGKAYERAIRLKIEQINQRGVLGGRKLRLLVSDNRSDRTLAVTNLAGYANNSEVAAIITGACTDCLLASAKVLNEKRIPTFSLAPAQGVVNPVGERRYIFKLGSNPGDGASALAAELRRASVDSVSILSTQDEYGADARGALEAELGKSGIRLRASGEFKPTDTDLGQVVERIRNERAEALVILAYPNQAGMAAVSARQAGFTGRIFFDVAAAGDLFLGGAFSAAADNSIMISTQTMAIDDVIATTPAKAARKQWFRDYTSKYGGYYGYASYAADAVQIITDAVTAAGGTNRERMRDIIENARMDGLSGPIRITPDNHSGLMAQALSVMVARGGRWRLVS